MSALPPEVTPEPDRERAASRSTWRVLLAVLVSVSLLSIVISQIDLDDALLRLRNAELTWICASFLMIALVMVFRGIRFWLVTQISRSGVVIAAVFLQNFFNRVMPFRLGELSLPYLLKKAEGEPVAPTVISLVLIRLMELWIVLVMAAVALSKTAHSLAVSTGSPRAVGRCGIHAKSQKRPQPVGTCTVAR